MNYSSIASSIISNSSDLFITLTHLHLPPLRCIITNFLSSRWFFLSFFPYHVSLGVVECIFKRTRLFYQLNEAHTQHPHQLLIISLQLSVQMCRPVCSCLFTNTIFSLITRQLFICNMWLHVALYVQLITPNVGRGEWWRWGTKYSFLWLWDTVKNQATIRSHLFTHLTVIFLLFLSRERRRDTNVLWWATWVIWLALALAHWTIDHKMLLKSETLALSYKRSQRDFEIWEETETETEMEKNRDEKRGILIECPVIVNFLSMFDDRLFARITKCDSIHQLSSPESWDEKITLTNTGCFDRNISSILHLIALEADDCCQDNWRDEATLFLVHIIFLLSLSASFLPLLSVFLLLNVESIPRLYRRIHIKWLVIYKKSGEKKEKQDGHHNERHQRLL